MREGDPKQKFPFMVDMHLSPTSSFHFLPIVLYVMLVRQDIRQGIIL